ncbi:uncharacterized protein LOC114532407 [Dendronephthya gigantea]|uniref:uncharacterized protein LOC114532407 n=1 Tax=Dendronephthya gigantea TaxID=151771 RepID=UPI00106B6D44|nr:uncharacterized protein LOC114532407 [Dendronephthya gigantea]
MSLQTLLSGFTIYYFSFALSLDYSSTLVSIEEYWLNLGGQPSVYGVVFGSYALAQIVSSPIFGYLADRKGTKFALCVSILINACGNALYGLAYVLDSKQAAVWGRFLSGFGAGSLILGIVHITNTTSREDRGWVVANFRIAQSLAYLGGPFLGLAFVPLQLPDSMASNRTATTKELILNFYTTPAWVAVLNDLFVMLPMVLVLFKNPFAPHAAMRFYYKDAKALIYHTAVIGLILFIGNLCLWGVISKLFSFAFAQYHIIQEQSDLWKVYIAAGTAFFTGSLLLRFLIKSKLNAVALSVLGLVTNIIGYIFLLDFNMTSPVSNAFFYMGSVLTVFGGIWFLTGIIVYYSQKITDYSNQARNRRGFFMGLLNIADAFGRFIGPAILTPIMKIQSSNQLDCQPTRWSPKNCTLSKVNIAMPINIVLVFANIVFIIFYHWNYGMTDFEASGSLVSHTSLSIRSQSQIQLEEVTSPEEDDDVFVENI